MSEINWNRRKYSKEQFVEAWTGSQSVAQVAEKLGCNKTGGGYYTLNDTAKALGLDKNHMTGQGWNSGVRYRKVKQAESLETVLVADRRYNTSHLKQRLWDSNLLPKECQSCGISEWQGRPAPLALDHIDGNNRDNRIENLRILCYNCHGQIPTFGKKIRLTGTY